MEYKRLSEVAYFSDKKTKIIAQDSYVSTENMIPNKGGVDVIESLPELSSASQYFPSDILLSNIRPYFKKIWFSNRQGSCSNDVLIIKTKSGYYPKFLYYVLSSDTFFEYDTVTSKGTKMPRGTKNAIMKYFVPNMPLSKQKKIAGILSAYDALIENNNKRIKIFERMAENLYSHFFSYEKIIDCSTEIRLTDIIKYVRGLSYSSEEIECEEGYDLINLKNINAYGGYRFDGTKKYLGKYRTDQIVEDGDLIMGITDMTQDRRTVGYVALIPYICNLSIITADLIRIESKIDKLFLYGMFRYGNLSKYISNFANGSNVLHLKPQSLHNVKILLPKQELIDKYVILVSPVFSIINNLSRQNPILIRQRDALLPRLMSGKLEVKTENE